MFECWWTHGEEQVALTYGAIYVKQASEMGLQTVGVSRHFWLYHPFRYLYWKRTKYRSWSNLQGGGGSHRAIWFQGYEVYTDNYYSSPSLFKELLDVGIRATETLRTNRTGVLSSVVSLKQAFEKKTERGTGYYMFVIQLVILCMHVGEMCALLPSTQQHILATVKEQ